MKRGESWGTAGSGPRGEGAGVGQGGGDGHSACVEVDPLRNGKVEAGFDETVEPGQRVVRGAEAEDELCAGARDDEEAKAVVEAQLADGGRPHPGVAFGGVQHPKSTLQYGVGELRVKLGELLVDPGDDGVVEVFASRELEGTAICVDQPHAVEGQQQGGLVLVHDDLKGAGEQTPHFDVTNPRMALDSRGQCAQIDGQQVSVGLDVGEVADGVVGGPKVARHGHLVDLPVLASDHLMSQQAHHGHEKTAADACTEDTRNAGPQIRSRFPKFGLMESRGIHGGVVGGEAGRGGAFGRRERRRVSRAMAGRPSSGGSPLRELEHGPREGLSSDAEITKSGDS